MEVRLFNNYTVQEAREKMALVEDRASFSNALNVVKNCLKNINMSSEILLELEKRAYYILNDYSEKDTKERVLEAKQRVLNYLDGLMQDKSAADDGLLLQVLENFYLFLEALWERAPHGKAGIRKEALKNIRIKNEYDVQHLLYAYLKPLFPDARAEVSEDTGYHTVRVDIFIDTDSVIEVKCTRQGMQKTKLIEEIEADMVHYSTSNIYFFVYDKEKLIENPAVFIKSYQDKIPGKKIYIVIHQPVIL